MSRALHRIQRPLLPVYDIVEVAVFHRRDDLLEEPLRLLGRRPPFGHDVIEQLSVRGILLYTTTAAYTGSDEGVAKGVSRGGGRVAVFGGAGGGGSPFLLPVDIQHNQCP